MIGYIYSYSLSLVSHYIATLDLATLDLQRLHFPTLTESKPSKQCLDVDCKSEIISGLDLVMETDTLLIMCTFALE